MITEYLNIKEIRNEISKDIDFVMKKLEVSSKKFSKLVKQRTIFRQPLYCWKEVQCPSNNRYLILFHAHKHQDWKSIEPVIVPIWHTSRGIKAAHLWGYRNNFMIFIYTSHFIKRYRERTGLDSMSSIDVIKRIIENNLFMKGIPLNKDIMRFSKELKDTKGKEGFILKEGLAFGTKLGNKECQLNTYISNEMMYKHQKNIAIKIREEYKKYYEQILEVPYRY